jgi:DNA polymerase III sliding clamp (beta) subunit (PCNA family)
MITFSTNFEKFKNALKAVLGASNSKMQGSTLYYVAFKLFNDKIELAATDGNRIRLKRLELDARLPEVTGPIKVLIDGGILLNQIKNFKVEKTSQHLVSMFFEYDDENKKISCQCPQIMLQKTNIITADLNYPQYEQLIKNYNNVNMNFINEMRQGDADTLKVSFTVGYLMDYLKNLDKKSHVLFEIKHNLGGVNVYSSEDAALFELLMPVQWKNIIAKQQYNGD